MHKHVGPQAPGPHGQQKGGDFATQPGGTVGRGSAAPGTGHGLGAGPRQVHPELGLGWGSVHLRPATRPRPPLRNLGPACVTHPPWVPAPPPASASGRNPDHSPLGVRLFTLARVQGPPPARPGCPTATARPPSPRCPGGAQRRKSPAPLQSCPQLLGPGPGPLPPVHGCQDAGVSVSPSSCCHTWLRHSPH